MKKTIKKVVALAVVCAMSFGTAFVLNEKQANDAQAWAGLGYLAAKNGVSAEAGLVIGVMGAWESTLQGAVWGAAFGGAVGAGVGLAVGL